MFGVGNKLKELKSKKTTNKDDVMEGYNPKVYRMLSLMFIVLGIINIVFVMIMFAKTGYGLWHAEDALSCIAKIDNSLNDINYKVLEISYKADDYDTLISNSAEITELHHQIKDNSDKFRNIDLSDIDKTLADDFEMTINKVNSYYYTVSDVLTSIKNSGASINTLRQPEIELMRKDAADAIHVLFEKQDKATYDFFFRVGKSFLLVILFLVFTMAAGLFAIAKAKKRDLEVAIKLQSSKKKTAEMRQKVEKIAYTNIVTGLRNRHVLFENLNKRIKTDELTVALYDLSNFKSINTSYGREYADDYMLTMSEKLTETFSSDVEIYSTEIDEICVVFNDDMMKSKKNILAQKILYMLSQPVHIDNATIQMIVAGSICYSQPETYDSASDMFKAIDKNIVQTKEQCSQQNRSILTIV